MLGTFLAGWHQGLSLEKFKRSIAAGSSTAFRQRIDRFFRCSGVRATIKIQEEE